MEGKMQRCIRFGFHGAVGALIAGVIVGTAACGGSGGGGNGPSEPPVEAGYVGAVPQAEFDALPPPSYALLADAYGRTLRDDPTALHLDGKRFSRKLFDMVKSLTASGTSSGTRADSGTTLLTLSADEWRLAIAEPVATYQTYLTKQTTENVIDEMFGTEGRQRNDKIDAFRIAYWNALSVQKLKGILVDQEKAVTAMKRVLEAHVKEGQTEREIQMDLNNGMVGRRLIVDNMTAKTSELKTICAAVPAEYEAPETEFGQFDFRTVYLANVTNMDGVWSGDLTNADSQDPEPWDAELHVNVYGTKVWGELHLFRGSQHARRRFYGQTDFGDTTFSFLYPYSWELGGKSPCIGMTATLHSVMNRLSGPWASSSCPQGGQIDLQRGLWLTGDKARRTVAAVNAGCPCSE
jgi:hypothetical protein